MGIEEPDPFVRQTPDDVLDPIWENAFGDGEEEMYRVAVSPAGNWGGKGPHVMFSLTSGTVRNYSEEYAAVNRLEVARLYQALGNWLAENPPKMPTVAVCPCCKRRIPVVVLDGEPGFNRHLLDLSAERGKRQWCVNSYVRLAYALVPNSDGTYSTHTGGTLGGTPARTDEGRRPT